MVVAVSAFLITNKPVLGHGGLLFLGIVGIAQWPQLAASQRFGKVKRVAAQHVYVLKAQWAEPLDIFRANVQSVRLELPERTFHVTRIPQNDGVNDQAEGPELVLLTFSIALRQLPALAMEDSTGEPVTRFAAIELDQNAPAIRFVIDVGEQKKRLCDTADLGDRANEARGPAATLNGAHELRSAECAELQ